MAFFQLKRLSLPLVIFQPDGMHKAIIAGIE
jgi:hypothetical protein